MQFWGQARTGHSWIGAALDADALVANEYNAVTYMSRRASATQYSVFSELAYNSFFFGMYGRV